MTIQRRMGARVRFARESHSMSQDELSALLGFKDRQTLSHIELGKHALRPDELLGLSEIFDLDVEQFVSPFMVTGEAQFAWHLHDQVPEERMREIEARASHWIGLQRWLREQVPASASFLKQTLRLPHYASEEEAQSLGERLAHHLGLGNNSTQALIHALDEEMGIPVLIVDLGHGPNVGDISGAVCHLEEIDVILLSQSISSIKRFFCLAHLLFHVLTWESLRPKYIDLMTAEKPIQGGHIESLADAFAAGLLSDVLLGDHGGPAPQDHLTNGQFSDNANAPALFSRPFMKELGAALDRGSLSVRKAAKTMHLDLPMLRQLFEDHGLRCPFDL